ncbi:3-deoxy-7-phosphoheptulonate synthase [Nocardiopsis changdeensis]|uniref:Phospho-2-dehydro-3-deoxyheptonate aldolase n=1 Tax=Nocardiopsis changdeensis TaxID=2831969 RepID=A0ABX8BSD5_9ACTN|nr:MULTISPECIES: 3-deoxy-7-phosphoheptulonate synthase [Nocardiopsis]QUX25160.1 3-deoxy-7-phosphoheptulonate synthase [Nocardiopsis changdeensis]QYX35547.1 3-deoxy-7-phosphoheptulonate synthase [Nocardiopsis sp. MT53]
MYTPQQDPPVPSAPQQPDWSADPRLPTARRILAGRPPLVRVEDADRLRARLARVAAGEDLMVVAGDCAEDPAECTAPDAAAKTALVGALADVVEENTGRPVVRLARIAGQFAKPRSEPFERVGGLLLPVYRGHLVNAPEPVAELRAPDPTRLLAGYDAARTLMGHLGWSPGTGRPRPAAPVWTAHEALLLDYEAPLLRRAPDGRLFLSSTHWPWIGDRTRDPRGAHVDLLARVANPVACKVGPSADPGELLRVCERLDPDRTPGRLTLIARMGADAVGSLLPPLVAAVRGAGHPVIWMSDPMHGNTVKTPSGLKTRYLEAIVREVRGFGAAVRSAGGTAGGLHLETTPDAVTECVPDRRHDERVADKYTSLCDPRLNPDQAVAVASAWSAR